MWPERTDAHVGSYAGRVCNGGVPPVKGMGLRSKLRLECRQGFCCRPQVSSVGSNGERKQESGEPHGKSMAETL